MKNTTQTTSEIHNCFHDKSLADLIKMKRCE
jgi:hypothetical protein